MKKILIIDDDATYRMLTEKIFTDAGYKVFIAENGQEGFKVAKEQIPDLIILDMIMPKEHGISALGHLQTDAETKDIPVIVWTNFTSARALIKDQKVAAFIVKSEVSNDELINKVNELLIDS